MAKASACLEEFPLDIDESAHALRLLRRFNEMRTQRKECDLVISVGGKEIHVHRSVMMAGSDFFDAMFTHDMEEKKSGVVEMKDISFGIMKKLVSFMYTGKISLVGEECEELLFASSMLQLTSVCDKIAPFLESHLTPSSFFATKRIADKFDLTDLKKVCNDFALINLGKIVKETEFNDLEKEFISFLVSSQKSNRRGIEDSKLAVVLQWIKGDAENRSQHLIELANLLDFRKISPSFGKYVSCNEQLCSMSSEFMMLLYMGSINAPSVEAKSASILSASSEKNSLVVFDYPSKSLRAYHPTLKSWNQSWRQTLHSTMQVRESYTAVATADFIYVFLRSRKAYRLDLKASGSSWESIPEMLSKHGVASAAVFGDDIYVVGSHSMERYHTVNEEWKEISCVGIQNCNYCGLVAHENFIYAVGGFGRGGSRLVDVSSYSTSTSSWSSVAPMPSPRYSPAVALHHDKIFVAGGHGHGRLNDFLSFDPRTNAWTQLSPMIQNRAYFKMFIIGDQLFAVGNEIGPCSIEMYDFEEEKWKIETAEDSNIQIISTATVDVEFPKS